jgi:PII-like signaling protein
MRALRVTIFIGETDRWEHRPLYMAILDRLKRAGCGGATVTRGVAGFGLHANVIKTANILRLSVDLPMVITVVDAAEKIERLLPEMSAMLTGGLVTIDETQIYFHSAAFHGGLPRLRVGDVMSLGMASAAARSHTAMRSHTRHARGAPKRCARASAPAHSILGASSFFNAMKRSRTPGTVLTRALEKRRALRVRHGARQSLQVPEMIRAVAAARDDVGTRLRIDDRLALQLAQLLEDHGIDNAADRTTRPVHGRVQQEVEGAV